MINEKLIYYIDGKKKIVEAPIRQVYQRGKNQILSDEYNDIAYPLDWYGAGYTVKNLFNQNDFLEIKKGIQNTILQIVNNELLTNFKSFQLEKYHHFVTDHSSHIKVAQKHVIYFLLILFLT